MEVATLGAGCFWCVETVYNFMQGVESAISGYAGGKTKNPTYKEVCSGMTGHAEVVQITYDPNVISYSEILEIFWTCHDPTQLNRQGNDVGTQYRSVIYYHDEGQKTIAQQSMKETAPTIWSGKIVTELSLMPEFYAAEDYHQDYFNQNPQNGYCAAVVSPKVSKIRKKYAHRLKA